MRGMYVDIWRPAHGVDTSMNGISRRFDTVILVGEGVPEIVETDEDHKRAPAVQLYRRWVGTPEEYLHAQPIGWGRGQGLGPMFGGGIEIWFAYVMALGFLLVRPQGLFGEKIIDRV